MHMQKRFIPALMFSISLAVVLACNTTSITNIFATTTPTPTNTSTITPTPTITPSPTPTITPTPTQTPTPIPTGINTQKQSDGSTLFTDYDNKFQLVLPKNWVIFPMTKEDIAQVLDIAAQEYPDLADEIQSMKDTTGIDTNMFRAMGLYADKNYMYKGYPTSINIMAIDMNPTLASMPLAFITGMMEEGFKQKGAKILTNGVNEIDNPNGVEMEYIDMEHNDSFNGMAQTNAYRIILFQTNKKLILFQLLTPKKFAKDILPIANAIGATIKLLK